MLEAQSALDHVVRATETRVRFINKSSLFALAAADHLAKGPEEITEIAPSAGGQIRYDLESRSQKHHLMHRASW